MEKTLYFSWDDLGVFNPTISWKHPIATKQPLPLPPLEPEDDLPTISSRKAGTVFFGGNETNKKNGRKFGEEMWRVNLNKYHPPKKYKHSNIGTFCHFCVGNTSE